MVNEVNKMSQWDCEYIEICPKLDEMSEDKVSEFKDKVCENMYGYNCDTKKQLKSHPIGIFLPKYTGSSENGS